jgi:hypothetical protein
MMISSMCPRSAGGSRARAPRAFFCGESNAVVDVAVALLHRADGGSELSCAQTGFWGGLTALASVGRRCSRRSPRMTAYRVRLAVVNCVARMFSRVM